MGQEEAHPQHRRNQKMLLFVDTTNPLWDSLLDTSLHDVNATRIEKLLKRNDGVKTRKAISATLLYNWRHGENISPQSADHIFQFTVLAIEESDQSEDAKKELIERVEKFKKIYRNDKVTLYDAGNALGMTIKQCRIIMDDIRNSHKPLFYKIYHDPVALAEYLNRYLGFYHVLVKRENVWLRCLLHVRYPLKIQEGSAIRCKLNIPRTDGQNVKPTYWQYDGFLAARPSRVFWMFEKRHYDKHDYFHFITDTGETIDENFVLSGTYLTTGPGPRQKIFHDDVLMKRVEVGDIHKIEELMKTAPGPGIISDPQECAAIAKELAALQSDRKSDS